MKLKTLLVAFAFVLLPMVFVHAEDGLTQCFDYYKFGSVQVDIAPLNRDALAGTELSFSGNIRNQNTYPVVDGAVYVKIFRRDPKGNTQANGWELVDQFFAKKGINVDGKKSLPVAFTWKAPAYLISGEYKVATYFVTQDKFNLSGLSFTDDIIGTSIPFTITSQQTQSVSFDRNAVKVGQKKHFFASFVPQMGKDEAVDITFDLKNTFATQKVSQITYTLYSWDGLRSDQVINTKKETVIIPANSKKTFSYKVTDTNSPVYYLVVEAKTDDAKSIIDVRFARQGVEKARLNFPALATYPLVKDSEATMFACFHNSGLGESVPNGKVVMTLKDSLGFEIDKYTYTGDITGDVMGIKKSFVPKKNFNNLTLTTELYVDNKLIETSHTKYKCEELNQELCALDAMEKVSTTSRTMIYVVIAVAILVLLVALLAYHGHLKRKDVGVASLLFFGTIGIGMYQVQAKLVDAAILDQAKQENAVNLTLPTYSVTGYYNYSAATGGNTLSLEAKNDLGLTGTVKTMVFKKNSNGTKTQVTLQRDSVGFITINNFTFQYNYGAEMKNAVTGAVIAPGSTIPAGTRVRFDAVPFVNNHIGWYLTGSTLDTPYAYWNNGTVPKCLQLDKFATQRFQNGVYLFAANGTFNKYLYEPSFDVNTNAYLPIVVDKPVVDVDTDGSSANVTDNGDDTFTVTSPGVIKGTVRFAPTTARAYFQYAIQNILGQGLEPVQINQKTIDFAAGQEAQLAAIPEGACQTLTTFPFQTEEQEIVFTANVVDAGNNPPGTPNFTMTGKCQNVPINGAATPVTDPDGDAVSYQFSYNHNNGAFSGWQTIPNGNVGFSFTPSLTGTYVVRVRAIDSKGLASAVTSKSEVVGNCDTVSAYCTDPTFVGDKPQWQATAFSSNQSITYTYSWSWPSRGFTLPSPNTLLSNNDLAQGSKASGPSVTVTPSVGAAQTLNCPEASRSSNTGDPSVSGYCELYKIDQNIPTWRAVGSGGDRPYTYTWQQPSRGVVDNDLFTLNRPLNLDETINDITVVVSDSDGLTKTLSCDEVNLKDTPSVSLSLAGRNGRKSDEITVKQNSTAFAYTKTNKVAAAQCFPQKIKTNGSIPTVPQWHPTANFASYGGLGALSGYPLDTSEVGLFELSVECPEQGNNSNKITSPSAFMRVVVDPDLEEI